MWGGARGEAKEPASQCARICQNYPLANYSLVRNASSPNGVFLGRVSCGRPGVVRVDVPGQKLRARIWLKPQVALERQSSKRSTWGWRPALTPVIHGTFSALYARMQSGTSAERNCPQEHFTPRHEWYKKNRIPMMDMVLLVFPAYHPYLP